MNIDMTPWISAAQAQLTTAVGQVGGPAFTILAALAGISLVMKIINKVTK